MSTLTLELNDSLFARLLAASRARNVPPAELARETLERTLFAGDVVDESEQGAHTPDPNLKHLGPAPKTLGECGRQWAGIAAAKQGESFDEIKRAAHQKRFGT